MDFLLSLSPAKSKSIKPLSTTPSLQALKDKIKCEDPFKYLNNYLKATQYSGPGLAMNLVSVQMKWAISGFVKSIVYITDRTALAWGTLSICLILDSLT